MRKRIGVCISLSALCLFSFAVSSMGQELQKVSLEEVLSVGTLDDDILFQWVGVVTDSKNDIYVTDGMDCTLKKFDSKGRLLGEAGRKGQGPGEFLAPRFVDCSGTLLYVIDQYIPGIHVFDKQLNFLRRIPLKIPVSGLRVLSDICFAVTTLSVEKTGKLFFYDEKGELIREFNYLEEKVPFMMDMVSFGFNSDGDVYIAYNFQDRIEKLDKAGKKIWSIQLLKGEKAQRKKVSAFVVPSEIVYKDIALDRSGNVYVLGGHFSAQKGRDVYVISPEGKKLTNFVLPDTSHCIHIDNQNYLYSRANDGVTLKKYRMHLIFKE